MSMTAHTCERCGRKSNVPDRYRGRALKCPGCGQSFTVPAAPSDERRPPAPASEQGARALAAAGRPAAPAAVGRPVARPPAARPATGPSGLGGWLAVIIGWLLVVSLATLYQYLQVRELLDDATIVRNLGRLQSGQALQYARLVENLNLFMVFAVVIAVLALFSYRRWARAVVVTLLLVAIGVGAWDYVWVTRVFDESTRRLLEVRPGFMDAWLAGRVVGCGLALAYFLGSTRVKNTFVK